MHLWRTTQGRHSTAEQCEFKIGSQDFTFEETRVLFYCHTIKWPSGFVCILILLRPNPKLLNPEMIGQFPSSCCFKNRPSYMHMAVFKLWPSHDIGVVSWRAWHCWRAWIPLLVRCPAATSWMCCSPSWLQEELTPKQEVRSCYVDRRLALTSTDPLRHNRPPVVH